jgi:hypothetical protein
MVPVRMMQVSADEIVRVVPMRDGIVTAAGPVPVGHIVPPARVGRGATRRVPAPDADRALVDVVAVKAVEVPVVQIVRVPLV